MGERIDNYPIRQLSKRIRVGRAEKKRFDPAIFFNFYVDRLIFFNFYVDRLIIDSPFLKGIFTGRNNRDCHVVPVSIVSYGSLREERYI